MVSRGLNYVSSMKPGIPHSIMPPSNSGLQAASLVMMVVLFSFGLLFPAFLSTRALPSNAFRDTISHSAPFNQGRIFNDDNYKPTSQNRDLAEIIAEQQIPLRRLAVEIDHVTVESLIEPERETHTFFDVPSLKKTTISEIPEIPQIPASEVILSDVPQMLHFKPNTTYLLCHNVSQIIPPPTMSSSSPPSDEFPPQIVFIIPPDSFGSKLSEKNLGAFTSSEKISSESISSISVAVHSVPSPSGEFPEGQSLLEVTCSILDVNFLPMTKCSPIENASFPAAVSPRESVDSATWPTNHPNDDFFSDGCDNQFFSY